MGKTKQAPKVGEQGFQLRPNKHKKLDKENKWSLKEGKDGNGQDMSPHMWSKPVPNDPQIYVKRADGSFVFADRPKRRRGLLPHSMLGRGEPVIGAGECSVDADGKITYANRHSGHYQPEPENMDQTKKNMEKQGLLAEGAKIEIAKLK